MNTKPETQPNQPRTREEIWDDARDERIIVPMAHYRELLETIATFTELRAELARERELHSWRDVKQELPEERQNVIGYFEVAGIQLTSWFQWETMEKPIWSPGDRLWGNVTHWKPLPEPPALISPPLCSVCGKPLFWYEEPEYPQWKHVDRDPTHSPNCWGNPKPAGVEDEA